MYKHLLKRLIDIVLSFCAIIVLAFPMAIISIIVKIDSKGPALFKQKRVGKDKKLFTILKIPINACGSSARYSYASAGKRRRYVKRFSALYS